MASLMAFNTSLEEYRIKKSKGVIAIKLKEKDSLVNIILAEKKSNIGILTKLGNYLIINTETINQTGRATSGVIGIKLSKEDEVVDCKIIEENDEELILISKNGIAKRISCSNFEVGNRATKGSSIQKFKSKDDYMVSFNTLTNKDKEVTLVSNQGIIKIPISDVQLLSKTAKGVCVKKMTENEEMLEILKVSQ